jgi:glycosyltransferase involved in cell wall biosynthesis
MKIGIDISLTIGEKAGVGYYSANLVEALAKIDKKNQYVLYPFFYYIYHPDFKKAVKIRQKNFHLHYENVPKWMVDLLWNSRIPKKWILGGVDILHSTTFCAPQDHYGKLIVTIYDLSFLTLPECHNEANRQHCLKGTIDAIAYADAIIMISHHAKSELLKYFEVDEEKVKVVHLAARDDFIPVNKVEQEKVLAKYQIPRDFIFTVGTFEPRKNIKTLVEMYLELPEKVKNSHPLVIAGGKGWLHSDLDKLISQNPELVRYIGYIPDKDLPALYSAASVFVYPSLYEGFGLPILEAMACGAPVITSSTSSMPEVSGDAAILFDPADPPQLKSALVTMIENEDLRAQLRKKGFENVRRFSWEKAARETLKIYQEIYSLSDECQA